MKNDSEKRPLRESKSPLVRERSRVQSSPAAPPKPKKSKRKTPETRPHPAIQSRIEWLESEWLYVKELTNGCDQWRHLFSNFRPTEVYRYYDADGVLLYVGVSNQFARRHATHSISAPWFRDAVTCHTEFFPTRDAAEWAEARAIREENPVHNIRCVGGFADHIPFFLRWFFPEGYAGRVPARFRLDREAGFPPPLVEIEETNRES